LAKKALSNKKRAHKMLMKLTAGWTLKHPEVKHKPQPEQFHVDQKLMIKFSFAL